MFILTCQSVKTRNNVIVCGVYAVNDAILHNFRAENINEP